MHVDGLRGVVGGDGIERKVDTIICATSFDVTYSGVHLYVPESIACLGVPDMSNFVMFVRPT